MTTMVSAYAFLAATKAQEARNRALNAVLPLIAEAHQVQLSLNTLLDGQVDETERLTAAVAAVGGSPEIAAVLQQLLPWITRRLESQRQAQAVGQRLIHSVDAVFEAGKLDGAAAAYADIAARTVPTTQKGEATL